MADRALEDLVAIVTGAGSGIGRGIAEGFVHAGARVAIVDREGGRAEAVAATISGEPGRAFAHPADVTDEDQVEQLASRVVSEHGRIDILVNNAGVASASPVAEVSLQTWEETLRVNLTSMFLTSRAVLPAMTSQRSGRIINIGSQLATRGAAAMSAYCAAKAGVHGFTKALAREVISDGITVNAIAPGLTETPAVADMPEDVLAAIKAEIPIGRAATVDEVVPTAILLASKAGGYYVGAVMNVSGGHVMD